MEEGVDSDPSGKLLLFIGVIAVILIVNTIPIGDGATNFEPKTKHIEKPVNKTMIPIEKPMTIIKTYGHYEPTHVAISSEKVTSTGARDTSGRVGSYARQGTNTFKNYCPNCHKHGTIAFESSRLVSYWTSIEGLWYCRSCDMDFSLCTGTEHRQGSNKRLIRC